MGVAPLHQTKEGGISGFAPQKNETLIMTLEKMVDVTPKPKGLTLRVLLPEK